MASPTNLNGLVVRTQDTAFTSLETHAEFTQSVLPSSDTFQKLAELTHGATEILLYWSYVKMWLFDKFVLKE